MANIVGYAALSHSPFWDNSLEVEGPGSEFTAGVKEVFDKVQKLDVDLVIIFGPDHLRNYFYGLMPPFCIGAGEIESFGDYGTHEGSVLGAPEAGQFIIENVRSQGFDPAFSLRMGIDHGIVQPYEVLFPSMDIPVVPIMIDCGAAPRPSFARSYDFGKAIRNAIDAMAPDLNVFLIASGGMSHERTKFDYAAGDWFAVVAINQDPVDFLDAESLQYWKDLGAKFIRINRSRAGKHLLDSSAETVVIDDVEGGFRDWYKEQPDKQFFVVRPDRYLALTCNGSAANEATKRFAQKIPVRATVV